LLPDKTMNRVLLAFLFLGYSFFAAAQQQPPFWNEIKEFKRQDSISAPPQNAILFIGSSSFRIWKTVQRDFPEYTIINRGFGGSTFLDVIRYADDIITPYHPKQVVIYCGDNDLAFSEAVTASVVMERFEKLFAFIRTENEKANIVFVSIKPSPSRQYLMPKIVKANALIASFINEQKNAAYIDVYDKMLNDKGEPVKDLFLIDMLHMNEKGYAIWKNAIKPYLEK